ncbi:MAG TPA: hypothetical protein VE665_11360 [Hyphomicrobiaceae bacterium]|jgi:hypothetical protein|nr:hypothetical protein [Hyphomicrobiaceae bacterium]
MYESVLAHLNDPAFQQLLLQFDEDLATEARRLGCPDCDGKLHSAVYRRKPRGTVRPLEPQFRVRFSFCCAKDGCRRRSTPASLRFLNRRIYLGAVVVLVSALRCGATPFRMKSLKALVGVSRQTVLRWQRWWREVFPHTDFWRAAQGALRAPVEIGALPLSLLDEFLGGAQERLLDLLRFLQPLSGGRRSAKAM